MYANLVGLRDLITFFPPPWIGARKAKALFAPSTSIIKSPALRIDFLLTDEVIFTASIYSILPSCVDIATLPESRAA
jgi:hypothetical protein